MQVLNICHSKYLSYSFVQTAVNLKPVVLLDILSFHVLRLVLLLPGKTNLCFFSYLLLILRRLHYRVCRGLCGGLHSRANRKLGGRLQRDRFYQHVGHHRLRIFRQWYPNPLKTRVTLPNTKSLNNQNQINYLERQFYKKVENMSHK